MTAAAIESLFDALSQKRDCCRALVSLAKRQRVQISAGDLGPVLEVLATKQRVMGRMDEIQRRLTCFSQGPQSWREGIDRQQQRRCQSVLDETERLLADLLEIEKHCEEELVRFREAAAEQLRNTDAGRQLNRAYLDETAAPTNRFVDLEAD